MRLAGAPVLTDTADWELCELAKRLQRENASVKVSQWTWGEGEWSGLIVGLTADGTVAMLIPPSDFVKLGGVLPG